MRDRDCLRTDICGAGEGEAGNWRRSGGGAGRYLEHGGCADGIAERSRCDPDVARIVGIDGAGVRQGAAAALDEVGRQVVEISAACLEEGNLQGGKEVSLRVKRSNYRRGLWAGTGRSLGLR